MDKLSTKQSECWFKELKEEHSLSVLLRL